MEQNREFEMKKFVAVLAERRYLFAMTAGLVMSIAVALSFLIPPVYEARTVVSIEKNMLNDIIKGIGTVNSDDDKVKALATIMKSRTLVSSVIKDLGLVYSGMSELQTEKIIRETQEKTDISIEFNRASKKDIDYFVVAFRDKNPATARDYVNSLVSRYIEENLHSKREGSFGANRFLLDQMGQYRDKVNKLNEEIANLRKNKALLFYGRYAELQKRLDDLRIKYTDDYPEVVQAKSDLAALKAQYRTAAGRSEKQQPDISITAAGALMSRLASLEEEKAAAAKIYEDLGATYGKSEMFTQAEIQDKAGTFRIVDPAVLPVKPASPNRLKIDLIGIAAGLGIAFFLIIALDAADQSIKDAEGLKRFGRPLLVVIPHIASERDVVRTRKKDRFLYGFSGLFAAFLITIIVHELLLI